MRSLYVTLLIVFVDQLSKLLVKGYTLPFSGLQHRGMEQGQSVPLIGDYLKISFVENPGMIFGIETHPFLKFAVVFISAVAAIALLYYIYTIRNQSGLLKVSLVIILGGAIGNLIDRVFYAAAYGYGGLFQGRVVDFIEFRLLDLVFLGKTYIFNIADTAVTVGVFLLLLFYLLQKPDHLAVPATELPAENQSATAGTEN